MKSKNGGLLRMPALKRVSHTFGRLHFHNRSCKNNLHTEANIRKRPNLGPGLIWLR